MSIGVSNPFQIRVVAVSNLPPTWPQAQWGNIGVPPADHSFPNGTPLTWPTTGTFQSNGWVVDPDGDPLTISNSAPPIQGLTWDPNGGKWTWSGTGPNVNLSGLFYTADDGHGHQVASSVYSLHVTGAVSAPTFLQPNPVYTELVVGDYPLGPFITPGGFTQATDVITVTPGFSLPAWLSLTGVGGQNLHANGTQVDANDVPATPGIRLRLTRSGFAPVDCPAFGVTVNPVVTTTEAWQSADITFQMNHDDFRMWMAAGSWAGSVNAISQGDATRVNSYSPNFGDFSWYDFYPELNQGFWGSG